MRNPTIIGEASKRLSSDFRRARPAIPWRSMAGMRDRLTHGHFGINCDIVWAVAHDEVPVLPQRLCGVASQPQEPAGEQT